MFISKEVAKESFINVGCLSVEVVLNVTVM